MTLIERIEAAPGPDRELDRLIQRVASNAPNAHWFLCHTGAYVTDNLAAEYTASIDAALTLVPEKWKLRQMTFSGPCADDRKWHLNLHGGKVGEDTFVGRGKTATLALCAAALRAREASCEA